ncbi:MAG: zinc ribbon domain-containing protein [Anaerolineales bacterium]|jgi:hypothetical protein
MRKLITMLTLLIVFLNPAPVKAQDEMHLSLLSIDIWPEYDQPAVLIIYHISLASDTSLPASLAIRIPSDVQINAVAVGDPTKGLLNAPYDNSVQGQWSVLKITTNSLQVQVEYYAPLIKNGTARHILFEWPGDYAVDKLEANFLKPFGAEGVSFSLAPTDTGPGQDGLINYHFQIANLAAGQSFSLTIDYLRQTDDLSISSLPVQAASTPGPDTPGRVSMTGILPWALAGIGFLLIVAGVVGFVTWQRGGQGTRKGEKYTLHREESEDEFTYCPQCGKRAQPGDTFCRTCGTRLNRGAVD